MAISEERAARNAAEILARGAAEARLLSPQEAARKAWYPGGPSVETLAADFAAQWGNQVA